MYYQINNITFPPPPHTHTPPHENLDFGIRRKHIFSHYQSEFLLAQIMFHLDVMNKKVPISIKVTTSEFHTSLLRDNVMYIFANIIQITKVISLKILNWTFDDGPEYKLKHTS